MLTAFERARRYIAKCPPAISGQAGHNATFHVASVLVHGFALGEAYALALLYEWNAGCQPPWSEADLVHKIKSAANAQHLESRGHLLKGGMALAGGHHAECGIGAPLDREKIKPRNVDPVVAVESFLKGFRCDEVELFGASPVMLGGEPRFDGAVLVGALYSSGEQINFVTDYVEETDKRGEVKARPVGKGITLEREALVERFSTGGSDSRKGGAWLRMNPVDGRSIADANVTAFRFALLESDKLPLELQVSLIAKLPLPVAAVIGSGGRSVHAWVKVDARDAVEYRASVARMLELLAKVGIDGKNKNPSRLSRLPGARREIGAAGDGIQRLMYLNPNPQEKGIFA